MGLKEPIPIIEMAPRALLDSEIDISEAMQPFLDKNIDMTLILSKIPKILYLKKERTYEQVYILKELDLYNKEDIEKHPEILFLDKENILDICKKNR